MTSIRTNCPRCGEVEMRADVITGVMEENGEKGTYLFICPVCEDQVEKPADRKIICLLQGVGVEFETTSSVCPEPIRLSGAPAITLDDVVEFHFLMEAKGPELIEAFGGEVASSTS